MPIFFLPPKIILGLGLGMIGRLRDGGGPIYDENLKRGYRFEHQRSYPGPPPDICIWATGKPPLTRERSGNAEAVIGANVRRPKRRQGKSAKNI